MKTAFLGAAAMVLFVALALAGGAGLSFDRDIIHYFAAWRALHPQATGWIILLTQAGGAIALIGLAVLGAAVLLASGRRREAVEFAAAVALARLSIELIKVAVHRPRPAFDAHPVQVFSQSFPSAHAGNSMATLLALALFLAPERHRGAGVSAAVAASLLIGATRPVLGVHWPTDVLGGWIYGATIVLLARRIFSPGRSAA